MVDLLTDMKIPTRAAPPVPRPTVSNKIITNGWANSSDLFRTSSHTTQKKKPPPRPPPPKFTIKNAPIIQEKSKKPARPTELLTNLFGRKGATKAHHHLYQSTTVNNFSSNSVSQLPTLISNNQNAKDTSICLIDLSPPGSPIFTTRSNSDAVSIDSFGSDGNSNPSAFTSSSSTSQTESAFEDDFDFFAFPLSSNTAASNKKSVTPVNAKVSDPWKITSSQDPFGPIQETSTSNSLVNNGVKTIGDTNFFAFNSFDSNQQVPSASTSTIKTTSAITMPTIIRTKGPKREVLPFKTADVLSKENSSSSGFSGGQIDDFAENSTNGFFWSNENGDESSPPMPKIPPPPPPPEYIANLEDGLKESCDEPCGLVLYDFPCNQPGDLELKQGDLVYLTKIVNDEWMNGRTVDGREGMFPINFIDIKVPLPDLPKNIVTALYPFKAEYIEDLSFDVGARIKVLKRVSDEWLLGEYNGKKGQFPANFVDRIPDCL